MPGGPAGRSREELPGHPRRGRAAREDDVEDDGQRDGLQEVEADSRQGEADTAREAALDAAAGRRESGRAVRRPAAGPTPRRRETEAVMALRLANGDGARRRGSGRRLASREEEERAGVRPRAAAFESAAASSLGRWLPTGEGLGVTDDRHVESFGGLQDAGHDHRAQPSGRSAEPDEERDDGRRHDQDARRADAPGEDEDEGDESEERLVEEGRGGSEPDAGEETAASVVLSHRREVGLAPAVTVEPHVVGVPAGIDADEPTVTGDEGEERLEEAFSRPTQFSLQRSMASRWTSVGARVSHARRTACEASGIWMVSKRVLYRAHPRSTGWATCMAAIKKARPPAALVDGWRGLTCDEPAHAEGRGEHGRWEEQERGWRAASTRTGRVCRRAPGLPPG